MRRVIVFDLDGVILDSMGRFQGPAQRRVAEVCGRPLAEVIAAQQHLNKITFTFAGWFSELGIDPGMHAALEDELRVGLTARARNSLYPGMRELLDSLSEEHMLVLVTAGDLNYQQWKVGLLDLDVFEPGHHHFVLLQGGSKADVIRQYLDLNQVTFVDDSPIWLREARERFGDNITLIRPRFPGGHFEAADPDDDKLWAAVDNVEQLEALLKWGV